jgi:hypothetical protein
MLRGALRVNVWNVESPLLRSVQGSSNLINRLSGKVLGMRLLGKHTRGEIRKLKNYNNI